VVARRGGRSWLGYGVVCLLEFDLNVVRGEEEAAIRVATTPMAERAMS
jgi:hypothetical protein